jgi:hypothetical protein
VLGKHNSAGAISSTVLTILTAHSMTFTSNLTACFKATKQLLIPQPNIVSHSISPGIQLKILCTYLLLDKLLIYMFKWRGRIIDPVLF